MFDFGDWMLDIYIKMHNVQDAQECDATGDAIKYKSWYLKKKSNKREENFQ